MRIWNGRAGSSAIRPQRSHANCLDRPDEAGPPTDRVPARQGQAAFLLAVEDIRRRGCAAAGVRLAGEALSGICRLGLYGAWRLLTVFEALIAAYCCSSPSTRARPILTVCCTQRLASTSPRNLGPSHHAAMPKGSHPSTPTSSNDSSPAWEISAARCPPAPGHPLGGVANTQTLGITEQIVELGVRPRETPRISSGPPSSEGQGKPPSRSCGRKQPQTGRWDQHEDSTLARAARASPSSIGPEGAVVPGAAHPYAVSLTSLSVRDKVVAMLIQNSV